MITVSQVKQKKKQREINRIKLKKTKIYLKPSFKPMWHEIKTWSYLELLFSTMEIVKRKRNNSEKQPCFGN